MACRTSVIPTRLSSIVRPRGMTTATRTITGFRSTPRKFPIDGISDKRPNSETMGSASPQAGGASRPDRTHHCNDGLGDPERSPCARADDAVRNQSLAELELPYCSFGGAVESAGHGYIKFRLDLRDQIARRAASQCGPSRAIRCRYCRRSRRIARHDSGYLLTEIVHVEIRIVLAAVRQGVLLVPGTHDRIRPNLFEDCRHASAIGVQLNGWP